MNIHTNAWQRNKFNKLTLSSRGEAKNINQMPELFSTFFFLFSIKKLLTGLLFYFLFHLSNFSLISLYETHPLCFRVKSAKAKYQQRRYKFFVLLVYAQ